MVFNMVDVYPTFYYLPTTEQYTTYLEDADGRLAYFTAGVKALAAALSDAINPLDNTLANQAAAAFATAYTGNLFGTYTATDNVASATVSTKTPTMTFSVTKNAATAMATLKDSVDTTDPEGKYNDLVTITSYDGLDGVFAFYKTRTMGTKELTYLYVTAYKGNLLVDGVTVEQYTNAGFATSEQVNAFLDAVVTALSV